VAMGLPPGILGDQSPFNCNPLPDIVRLIGASALLLLCRRSWCGHSCFVQSGSPAFLLPTELVRGLLPVHYRLFPTVFCRLFQTAFPALPQLQLHSTTLLKPCQALLP